MVFRKADESDCADDGTERYRTYTTLLSSAACCSVSLITLSRTIACNTSFVHLPGFQNLTQEEIATDAVKMSAMDQGSDNELDEAISYN